MKIQLELRPLLTQAYVSIVMPANKDIRDIEKNPVVHIKDLDADTLSALCNQHRKEMFALAEKEDPKL